MIQSLTLRTVAHYINCLNEFNLGYPATGYTGDGK